MTRRRSGPVGRLREPHVAAHRLRGAVARRLWGRGGGALVRPRRSRCARPGAACSTRTPAPARSARAHPARTPGQRANHRGERRRHHGCHLAAARGRRAAPRAGRALERRPPVRRRRSPHPPRRSPGPRGGRPGAARAARPAARAAGRGHRRARRPVRLGPAHPARPSDLPAIPCPHPSPRVLNSTPGARARITHALRLAALIAATDPPTR